MAALLLGLLLFLGAHSLRFVAPAWRERQVTRLGENGWKACYSLVSAAGLGLIVWGYALARSAPVDLWLPPLWTRHLAVLLVWPAFVLLTAAYVPGTRLKARLHHPMVAGVVIWATAHLLANGRLADVLLFGSFLLWGVLDFAAARRRDRVSGVTYPEGSGAKDLLALVIGSLAWAVFVFWAHARLFGVAPLG